MISLLPYLYLWRWVRDYEVKKELTLSRDFGALIGIFLTYGMFKTDLLDFHCGSYISCGATGVGGFADKYWLRLLEVC